MLTARQTYPGCPAAPPIPCAPGALGGGGRAQSRSPGLPRLASFQGSQGCRQWLQTGKMGGGRQMMENGRRKCVYKESMYVDSNI